VHVIVEDSDNVAVSLTTEFVPFIISWSMYPFLLFLHSNILFS
jgi:hypothetical protein